MVAVSELMTFLKHPEATEEIQVDSALSILKIAGKSLLIIYLGAFGIWNSCCSTGINRSYAIAGRDHIRYSERFICCTAGTIN